MGWHIYVGIPTASVMQPVRRFLIRGLLGGFAIIALVSAAAPSNTALPTIAGTTSEGQQLSADPGTWTEAPADAKPSQDHAAAKNGPSPIKPALFTEPVKSTSPLPPATAK